MKYEVKFTSQFKKDLKLAKKQGKDIGCCMRLGCLQRGKSLTRSIGIMF